MEAAKGNEGAESSGLFWPYNSALKQSGIQNFISFWGERELEDNWRRRNKIPSFSNNETETEVETEVTEDVIDKNSPYYVPTIEELLEQLPCSTDEVAISDSLIAAAYYNNGLIYKEKLDDFDAGIDSWETLVTTQPEGSYHPTGYYQLFRSFYKKEQEGYTNFWMSYLQFKILG